MTIMLAQGMLAVAAPAQATHGRHGLPRDAHMCAREALAHAPRREALSAVRQLSKGALSQQPALQR